MRVIPKEWLTPAKISRVVCHWSAGAYVVGDTELEHYHVIIGRATPNGAVKAFRGDHTPADNNSTADDDYAAHTRDLNSNSFGLSVACMAGAKEGGPYGKAPLTKVLWERMALAAAEVCVAYGLDVAQRTVLFHSEVQAVYHKPQAGKWDINVLMWEPHLSPSEVHNQFRGKVAWYIANTVEK